MFYQIREYKKDGEIIFPCKLFDKDECSEATRSFCNAVLSTQTKFDYLASDDSLSQKQLNSIYDSAVHSVELVSCDDGPIKRVGFWKKED